MNVACPPLGADAPWPEASALDTRPPPKVIVRTPRREREGRWAGIAIVVAVHVAALWFLLEYEPARNAIASMAPIMVDLITPPKIIEPPPPPPPPPPRQPKPRLEPLKTIEPPPLLAAQTPAPTPTDFVVPPPPPAPPVQVAESAAPPAPPAPAPVTPPSFNAAYLQNKPPQYPVTSRRMAEEGRVMLRVLVSAAGEPEKVEVRTTSGFDRLDAAAVDAVRSWRFVPAQQAGRAVAAWVQVPLVFSLSR